MADNKEYVYVTYIKTTPEKVWTAITTPEFTRQYWSHGIAMEARKGSKWTLTPKDTVMVGGEVLESVPPKRLVMTWAEATPPSATSQVAFDLEALGDVTRLTVTHSKLDDYMAGRISTGWPLVLSNMKSLLETGKAYDISALKVCAA
jgi:uncharacterized protein YndB with AHSA1/START domain